MNFIIKMSMSYVGQLVTAKSYGRITRDFNQNLHHKNNILKNLFTSIKINSLVNKLL